MATVIDELVVTLGLDGRGLNSDAQAIDQTITKTGKNALNLAIQLEVTLRKTQEATVTRIKQTEEVGRKSSQQFGAFRKEVALLFTTLATGFGLNQFIKSMVATEAQTGRLAKNIGMSAGELNAWQEAAKRSGGSAEGISGSFQGLTQQFQQFAMTGQSAVIPYFRALGVSIADTNGEMRPLNDIMLDLADKFSHMTPQRANAFGSAIGLDQGTIQLLMQGRQAVEDYLGSARKLGVMNDEQAASAIRFQQRLSDLEQSFTNLGRVVLDAALPQITEFIGTITKWVSDPANQKFISDEVIGGIIAFGSQIHSIVGFFEEFRVGAEALAAYMSVRWLSMMMLGLGPVGVALGTIAAAIVSINEAKNFFDPSKYSNNSIFWGAISKEDQLKYENSPESRKARGEQEVDPNSRDIWHPSTWFGGKGPTSTADTSMNNVKRGFLDTIAIDSGNDYHVMNGGERVEDLSAHPQRIGNKGTSTAFGRYQITKDTYKEFGDKYNIHDMQPASQDKMAWAIASERYAKATGGNLEADIAAGGNEAKISAALKGTWSSLPGGVAPLQDQTAFARNLRANTKPSGLEGLRQGMPSAMADTSVGRWLGASAETRGEPKAAANTNHIETNINGPITVTTNATDANGVAAGLHTELKKYNYVGQANTGLN